MQGETIQEGNGRESSIFLPLGFPVLWMVRRMSRTLGFGGWVSGGWGPGRAAERGSGGAGVIVPVALDLAPGRNTHASALSVPRVPPRAGTKQTPRLRKEC